MIREKRFLLALISITILLAGYTIIQYGDSATSVVPGWHTPVYPERAVEDGLISLYPSGFVPLICVVVLLAGIVIGFGIATLGKK